MRNVASIVVSHAPTVFRFGIVGLITTTLDAVAFAFFTVVFGLSVLVANPISYSLGIVTSFFLNNQWTFRDQVGSRRKYRVFLLFFTVNILGLLFSTFLVFVFSHYMNDLLAKLISIPIVFVWNYLSSRFLVFRKATEKIMEGL